jgi:SNF2 family DNA or RNA helicase
LSSSIHLELAGEPPKIAITVNGVDDLFSARLRAELGASGLERIELPLDHFLMNRSIVQALCAQFRVDVTADAAATVILTRTNRERQQLDQIYAGVEPASEEVTTERLRETRFGRQLLWFQVRDLAHLLAIPNGANFSVPGAGKTTVAYATYEAERAAGRVDRLLVVGPLSAFEAWASEPEECFHRAPEVYVYEPGRLIPSSTEVVIVNYSKLLNRDVFNILSAWLRAGSAHVILDEVHRIKKGRAGAWGAAALELAWYAARRDVLSGTPAPQHPSDLEAPLEFLWPGQARRILPRAAFDAIPPVGIGHQLATALGPLHVRTKKSELGLDEPSRLVLEFELHGLQREIYLAITNQYSGLIPASRRDRTRLAEMRRIVMYLLEAATNPALLSLGSSPNDPPVFLHPRAPIPADSDLVQLLNEYGRYETPPKFRKLGEIVRDNAAVGRKTLVWSNFVRNLELLRRDLARYSPAMVHGGVPSVTSQPAAPITREMELDRFRSDPDCAVLLANPAAMSEGISLHHECHDAVYLERTFNAGQYLQSVDRIHRLGLAPGTETRITYLVTKDTVDEVVHRRVSEKATRLAEMLSDPDIVTMALPDDDDLQNVDSGFGQPLDDDEDISALFAHLRGDDG